MNQVVRLGDRLVRQGVLALVLFVLSSGLWGQQQKTQDQSVPDAPTPQEPDSLGKITSGMTPGKGSQETPAGPGNKHHPGTARHGQPAIRPGPDTAKATRNSRARRNPKGSFGLSHHGQLRHCAGDRAGQETSTSGRLDLAGFPDIRERPTASDCFFQRRSRFRSPLPWSSTRACPGTP